MDHVLTGGRYPSYGLVREYYARSDFLRFLRRVATRRQVVLVIPRERHWQPRWQEDRVQADTDEQARTWLLGRLDEAFPDADPEARLPFYPSFHQSLEERVVLPDGSAVIQTDGVAESDGPTWRESFHDVLTLVEVLHLEGVPHRLKFSGHRSLHVVVPFAGKDLIAWPFGQSNAHGTALLRMPYSLNEDTGLVSLPLSWDTLPSFRPWQAAIPLVRPGADGPWLELPDEEGRRRAQGFVRRLKGRAPVARRAYFGPAATVVASRARALATADPGPVVPRAGRARSWHQLLAGRAPSADELVGCLAETDTDAGWLAAEAVLLHGDQLSAAQLASLLERHDAYLQATCVDLLERFPERGLTLFSEVLQRPELGAHGDAVHLLGQSPLLADLVMRGLGGPAGDDCTMACRVACIRGVHQNDWQAAHDLRTRAQATADGPAARRLEALGLIEAMARSYGRPALLPLARQLAALGPAAVDLVLLACSTPARRLARGYLHVLADMADGRALPVLVRALGQAGGNSIALRGLMRLGSVSVPALLEASTSDDSRVRRYALRALAGLGDPRAWPALVEALSDADGQVRREAARGLRAPAAPAIEALRQAAGRGENGGSDDPAFAAVQALASHGSAGQAAVAALAHGERNLFAAAYLVAQGDSRARQVMLEALDEGPLRQFQAAVLWTGLVPDATAARVIIGCLPRLSVWGLGSVFALLVSLGLPEATDAVLAAARSDDSLVRRQAARALGGSRDPRVLSAIVDLALDPHPKVREHALVAALSQGAALLAQVNDRLAALAPDAARRRPLASLGRLLAAHQRLGEGEALTLDLVQAVAAGPKPLWDAARRRVARDLSGADAASLRCLSEQARSPAARFLIEQLLRVTDGAAADEGVDQAQRDEEDEGAPGRQHAVKE